VNRPLRPRSGVLAILLTAFAILSLAGCSAATSATPTASPVILPSQTASLTPVPTSSPTPLPSSTPKPLTLVFYGDSVLKVGDVSRESEAGFSIVDDIQPRLNPADTLIVQNHGGRGAQWAFANLDKNVLSLHPDVVTLWWGLNDLGGCPGTFDRATNRLVQYKLTALVKQHIKYMQAQIDALLAKNAAVIVITSMPVLGTLPWSHFTPDNQLVWENDYRCDFNVGLGQLVEAQRKMVADNAALGKPVYLVDAWQIYNDHPNTDNMYMDIVHPASTGAELIAAGWLEVFQSIEK
jgi:lysophospholipase L1-like esterase